LPIIAHKFSPVSTFWLKGNDAGNTEGDFRVGASNLRTTMLQMCHPSGVVRGRIGSGGRVIALGPYGPVIRNESRNRLTSAARVPCSPAPISTMT
jgi:hypothetical protein